MGAGGTRPWSRCSCPTRSSTAGVARAWWTLGGVALFLLGASVLVSDRLAGRVVRSARGLAEAARTLGDHDLNVRVRPRGPRELAEAAAAFNAMADRVAMLRAAERELFADLSHRLRTPLTALRLEAERVRAARRQPPPRSRRSRRWSSRSTTSSGPPAGPSRREPEPAALRRRRGGPGADGLLGRGRRGPEPAGPGARRRPRGCSSRWPAASSPPRWMPCWATFSGTPRRARRSTSRSARRDGYVAVRVDDSGPGIGDPDRALRRGSSDRGSTGLGLDIVRRAAIAGRGDVAVDRNPVRRHQRDHPARRRREITPRTRPRRGFAGWRRRDQE